MKQLFLKNKNYVYFDGIQDLTEYLKTAPIVCREGFTVCTEDPENAKGSFYGGISYQEALSLLEHGDRKTAQQIKEIKDTRLETKRMRQTYETAVVGFIPHVPNLVMGLPNSMINIRQHRVSGNNKMIDLVIDADASCSVGAKEYAKVARSFLDIVDNLERQGYRLNLYYAINTYFSETNTKACWLLKLKSSNEPFNKYKCAFPLGNVSMFRRIGFRLIETLASGAAKKNIERGYGRPNSQNATAMIQDTLYILNGTQPKNLKVLDIKDYVHSSEEDMITHILDNNSQNTMSDERKKELRREASR